VLGRQLEISGGGDWKLAGARKGQMSGRLTWCGKMAEVVLVLNLPKVGNSALIVSWQRGWGGPGSGAAEAAFGQWAIGKVRRAFRGQESGKVEKERKSRPVI